LSTKKKNKKLVTSYTILFGTLIMFETLFI